MNIKEESFTVSELNNLIKDVVNAGFPRAVWLCGEIQGYDRSKMKNHIFFELVEKDAISHEVKAKIGLVIFAGKKAFLEQILKEAGNNFTLKDDIEVKFLCRVDFYAPHGAMRLIVENIDTVYTLGKLAQERQKLVLMLKDKGILDKNKQLPLPLVPLEIGLITSDDSAAYNDFISELRRSGLSFKVYLKNTLMQGKKCELEVCNALRQLQKIKSLDVIVITRGGGSIAELSCFDNQKMAEAIAHCRVPVLSGIGHEINTTIVDLAAHTFAKTPTAIAQFLVGLIQDFLRKTDDYLLHIIELSRDKISTERQHLKEIAYALQHGTQQFLKDHNENILDLSLRLKQRPLMLLRDHKRSVLNSGEVLLKCVKTRLFQDQLKLRNYTKMVDMLAPINTMKRGFTITRTKSGKVVKDINQVTSKDEILTEVVGGKIESLVQVVNKDVPTDLFRK